MTVTLQSIGPFNNSVVWTVDGAVSNITATTFSTSLSPSVTVARLVSTPLDLTDCDLSVKATRQAGETGITINLGNDLIISVARDDAYGLLVGFGGGFAWVGSGPVSDTAPQNQETEMRIKIQNGIAHFYYNGVELWDSTSQFANPAGGYNIPGWMPVNSATVSIGSNTGRLGGVGVDTYSLGTIAPTPLAINVVPNTATIMVGQSQTFTAIVTGGQAPYGTIVWIDNSNQTQVGTGTTFTFIATAVGTYQVFARVVDGASTVANSAIVNITVSNQGTTQYTLTINSSPISGVPFTITQV